MTQPYRLTILLCLISELLFAQDIGNKFMHLSVDDGLPTNHVTNVLRDSRGFLWVATTSGLARYDGNEVRLFHNNEGDSSSLLNNHVYALHEDPEKKLWVLTTQGMCVYDPRTERFQQDISGTLNKYQLPRADIWRTLIDSSGNFWILQETNLYKHNIATKVNTKINIRPGKLVSDISEAPRGELWLICRDGSFYRLDKNQNVVFEDTRLTKKYLDQPFCIEGDDDGDLWIYSSSTNLGVYHFDSKRDVIQQIHSRSNGIRLNSDIVRDVETDDNGWVWVATDHGGINLINKENQTNTYITSDRYNKKSLSENSVTFLYKDREHIMWVGTNKQGLNYYHQNFSQFKLYQNNLAGHNSLPHNDINTFAEDAKGNLWIGTNGGGLIYFDRKKNTFRQYLNDPKNPSSLSSNIIVSLLIDRSGLLWIGTYFGGLDHFDGKKFTHFQQKEGLQNQLSDNSIWDITQDARGNLWIGTLLGSLNKYDPVANTFHHYNRQEGIFSRYVTSILEDIDGSIWVGTGYGLTILKNGSEKFVHHMESDNKGSLNNNHINCLYKDSKDVIWIGSQKGLNVYNRKKRTFQYIKTIDGRLPADEVIGITEDNFGRAWVVTTNGLASLTIQAGDDSSDTLRAKVLLFDDSDGLQGRQFNSGAIIKTKDGHLFFGGTNGLNELDPSVLEKSSPKPEVVMVKLLVDNNEIKAGQEFNGQTILSKPIAETTEVTLPADYNSFSVDFTSVTFLHKSKNRFRFKLIGFDKDWVEVSSNDQSARYTNIDPGTYQLVIESAGGNGVWNQPGARLGITILPPFWKSNTGVILYVVAIIAALFFARYLILKREKIKYLYEKEQEAVKRAQEVDRLKIKFITNVSHEFRTPLSLIITPVESMIAQKETNVVVARDHLELIHRNAKRLLNLVNQLLDFRRLEVEEVNLNPSEGDITMFIRELLNSFSDLAEKKNINFSIDADNERAITLFDANKLERIVFNLLSNAFKFTPAGGNVSVRLTKEERGDLKFIKLEVKDTGVGIAPEHLDKIFERFFQTEVPSHLTNEGNGIGLSITREFVRLHGGEITVSSELNKGSCFTVTIPLCTNQVLAAPTSPAVGAPTDQELSNVKRKLILLVEDNEEFRFYLKDNLKSIYDIEQAGDGVEAWRKTTEILPDIIVSDIMMPGMNGIELCSKVKSNDRTSHIPILLLTARSSDEQRLEGLETGADDYIVKPFNFEILHARIRNLISRRLKFHKKFQQNVQIQASEIKISSLDEIFIAKAVKTVEDNISDPDFGVEELSRELGISRANLYRKLLALTGKSAIEFIRVIKLQRAAQLLEKSQLTVAEVAYSVGFNNPKYFTKYFKEQYHVVPSAYANRKGDGLPNSDNLIHSNG